MQAPRRNFFFGRHDTEPLLLHLKDQKIVLPIRFGKVVGPHQLVTRICHLPHNHILLQPMVSPIAIAVDDPHFAPGRSARCNTFIIDTGCAIS